MRLPSYQDLSKEQDAINSLPLDESFLVTGPPGTGKTVMALYRAAMLTSRKRPVKLLMYNRLLSQYTGAAIKDLLIDGAATTFHSWFPKYFWSNYKVSPPQIEPYTYDWDAILTIINSRSAPARERVHLIIDEGQDMPSSFYYVTRLITSSMTVFADENQRINESNSTISEIRVKGGFRPESMQTLTRNYRNTREIAELAAVFYTGLSTGVPDLPGRSGELPVIIRKDDLESTIQHILYFERTHRDLEIGVFVTSRRMQECVLSLIEGKAVNPVQTYRGGMGSRASVLDFDTPGIKVINQQSAKGLEFDAVFIPELQEMQGNVSDPEWRMKMYVMVSRAREQLYLMYSGAARPRLLDIIPPDLVESFE